MSRDLKDLHPEMRELCEAFIAECHRQGLKVGISATLRGKAEQDGLYAQGRTMPGSIVTNCRYPYSGHNWGVAFDIYRNDGKGAYNDSGGWFKKCGQIGKKMGLFWGGDFRSFVDKPHFELPKYMPNNSTKGLIAKYGTPEKFMATWEDEEMTQEQFDKMMDEYLAKRAKMPVSAWAAKELAEAKSKGIMDGTRPRDFVTREEAAAMVVRGNK